MTVRGARAPRRARRGGVVAGAVVSALAALLCPAPARADAPAIAVDATGCGELRVEEVQRLLAIELAGVSLGDPGTAAQPEVHLACEGNESIGITVSDPLTDKRLERRIPAPPATAAGRERVIALAVSQLFLTSWMELLMTERARVAAAARTAAPSPAVNAAARLARNALAPEVLAPTSPWRVELAVVGGVRVRDLTSGAGPYLAGQPALRVGLSRGGAWWGWLLGGFEYGRAVRARGAVEMYLGRLGAGLAWRSRRLGPVTFDLGATAALVYARLEGRAVNAGATLALSVATFGGELALAAGPTLHAGPVRVGLAVEAGATLPVLTGDVSNEAPVSTGALWLGAALALGFELTGR